MNAVLTSIPTSISSPSSSSRSLTLSPPTLTGNRTRLGARSTIVLRYDSLCLLMAPEWEMAMMGIGACYSISSAAVSPLPSTSATPTSPAYLYGPVPPTADAGLCVDDLLDFSHHDLFPPVATDTLFYATTTVEPSLTTGGSTLSEETFSVFRSQQASSDLYIPVSTPRELGIRLRHASFR